MKRRTFFKTIAAAVAVLQAGRHVSPRPVPVDLGDQRLVWSANDTNYGRHAVAA